MHLTEPLRSQAASTNNCRLSISWITVSVLPTSPQATTILWCKSKQTQPQEPENLFFFSLHPTSSETPHFLYAKTSYRLVGNPVCSVDPTVSGKSYCSVQEENKMAYTTSLSKCSSIAACSSDQSLNPANCGCAFPYTGKMIFRAPLFTDLTDTNSYTFQQLETSLTTNLSLRDGSVFLSDIKFNSDNYLQIQVKLFPSSGVSFNVSDVIRIGSDLSNQIYKPPKIFGPYYFIADVYAPLAGTLVSPSKTPICIILKKKSGICPYGMEVNVTFCVRCFFYWW